MARKLTDAEVRQIREFCEERRELLDRARALSERSLASMYGVSRNCVNQIGNYRTYKHVK